MVEVFQTNVQEQRHVVMLEAILSSHFPMLRIDFDIEDCDRILRVEGKNVLPEKIIEILKAHGYHCLVLE
jgi:hypothetical protein